MHILVTNDDGPPDEKASPYITSFVRTLRRNHKVSVVVPSQQRSWIGKAHLVPLSFDPKRGEGKESDYTNLITPCYYYPATGDIEPVPREETSKTPNGVSEDEHEPWVLVPGTPAACAQLGLFHLFKDQEPIDMVISGPNHGRNTTASFALSSGTLGGALEAAICGKPAIALSYAFFTRQESEDLVNEANELALRIIEHLGANWGQVRNRKEQHVDLYSINIPLVAGISKNPIRWTWMLDNKWSAGSLYQETEAESAEGQEGKAQPRRFKWAPTFQHIWKTVEVAAPGNDGWAIREQCTSVTPLLANFMHAGPYGDGIGDELKL